MKARVKATGKVVELYDWCEVTEMDTYKNFTIEQLEFISDNTNYTHDYWDKLLHQYAGIAMQGLIAGGRLDIELSYKIAHTLVEKLKERRKGSETISYIYSTDDAVLNSYCCSSCNRFFYTWTLCS